MYANGDGVETFPQLSREDANARARVSLQHKNLARTAASCERFAINLRTCNARKPGRSFVELPFVRRCVAHCMVALLSMIR